MKTVKWVKGLEGMLNKNEAKGDVYRHMNSETFPAEKRNFSMLAKRSGIKGWRNAVLAIVNKNDTDDAINLISGGDTFCLNKTELRRAANLV